MTIMIHHHGLPMFSVSAVSSSAGVWFAIPKRIYQKEMPRKELEFAFSESLATERPTDCYQGYAGKSDWTSIILMQVYNVTLFPLMQLKCHHTAGFYDIQLIFCSVQYSEVVFTCIVPKICWYSRYWSSHHLIWMSALWAEPNCVSAYRTVTCDSWISNSHMAILLQHKHKLEVLTTESICGVITILHEWIWSHVAQVRACV